MSIPSTHATVAETAALLGSTKSAVYQAIRRGHLAGEQLDGTWVVPRADITVYQLLHRKPRREQRVASVALEGVVTNAGAALIRRYGHQARGQLKVDQRALDLRAAVVAIELEARALARREA